MYVHERARHWIVDNEPANGENKKSGVLHASVISNSIHKQYQKHTNTDRRKKCVASLYSF